MSEIVLDSLNNALYTALENNPRVILLGEDILDPYGGAFKVTRGLSTKFPQQVIPTPISEAAIVGVATGMAMRGYHPVVEIMFGDFITLIMDQVLNHATKFHWMYNEQVSVPLVIRTPMGGRRGYGPTHSQSLEKHFLGIPGLKVIAPSTVGYPGELLLGAINHENPVLFIEHKLLYPCSIKEQGKGDLVDYRVERSGGLFDPVILHPPYPSKLTIATYGYNLELALAACLELMMEREVFCELVVFSQLSPCDLNYLFPSIKENGHLLVLEEGIVANGWGAEVLARVHEAGFNVKSRRIGGWSYPIANSRALENSILPSKIDIVQACSSLLDR
jgi:pyruvate/2-oxoglutarate/acetoin dehydrogenase E1 component